MPFTTSYNNDDKILVTRIWGVATIDLIKDGLAEIMKQSIEYDCFLWLNDFSESILDVSIFKLFQYAESVPGSLEKFGNNKSRIRRAIVRNDQAESFAFFENASVNRGVITRVFADPESARNWLLNS